MPPNSLVDCYSGPYNRQGSRSDCQQRKARRKPGWMAGISVNSHGAGTSFSGCAVPGAGLIGASTSEGKQRRPYRGPIDLLNTYSQRVVRLQNINVRHRYATLKRLDS